MSDINPGICHPTIIPPNADDLIHWVQGLYRKKKLALPTQEGILLPQTSCSIYLPGLGLAYPKSLVTCQVVLVI